MAAADVSTRAHTAPARTDSSPEWIIAADLAPEHGVGKRVLAIVVIVTLLPFVWLGVTQLAGPHDGTLTGPYMAVDRWLEGVPVERVRGDAPLRAGDVITAIDGRSVANLDAYDAPAREAGDVVRYTVSRNGKRLEVDVRLTRFDLLAGLTSYLLVFPVPLILLAVAAFVFARRPRERSAQLMLAVGAFLLAGEEAWPFGLRVIDFGGGRGVWPHVGGEIANSLMWGAFLHFALVFPSPPRVLRRRPWLVAGCYLLPFVLFGLGWVLSPPPTDPLARLTQAATLSTWAALVMPPLLALAFVARYFRTPEPGDRRRLRYVVASLVGALALYVLLGQVPDELIGHPLVSWNVLELVFILCPIAIAAAILRSQLFDIQVMMRRSLIFGLLTAGLLAVSFGVLAGLTQLFSESSPVFALIAGCAVALCFHPLRSRLQVWVGEFVFGARQDPYQVVSELGRLDPGANASDALQRTVETLAGTLRLSYAAVELASGPKGTHRQAAVTGRHLGGAPITIPLGWADRTSGWLLLETMPGREPFGRADRRLLEDVASQVSRLTDLAQLNAALRASRTRIITAREEERRRLHRDLHDGIGPSLAAQTMQLDLARLLIASEPEEADHVLAEIAEDTKGILAELRRVVDDLRPQSLDQLGLASGIRERSRLFTIAVDVVETTLPELPAAVEVAAYRIAIEAVNNAARHGQAKRCRVNIDVVADELVLTVRDDGIGLPAQRRSGVGLGSMRERAEELGGRFDAHRASEGGTVIRAVIPLAPLRDATTS